jgi:hypothetical protein
MSSSLTGIDILTYDSRRESTTKSTAATLVLLCILLMLSNPGTAIGALTALWFWRVPRARSAFRWTLALSLVAVQILLHNAILVAWPWRLAWGTQLVSSVSWMTPVQTAPSISASVLVESFAGPLILQAIVLSLTMFGSLLTWQLRWQRRANKKRAIAVNGPQIAVAPAGDPFVHPHGCIRLGIDRETRRPVDLAISELAEHVFIPGASGSGKTTTLSRLSAGALRLGHSLIVIDCKGGDLKQVSQDLADKQGVSFNLIDPDDPATLRYDPCSGTPADVSNKLVGVFNYSDSAEIFKLVSMRALPLLVRAMQAAKRPVTLDALKDLLLSPGGMERLGRDVGEPHREVLNDLSDEVAQDKGGVLSQGHMGLGLRFGALLSGKFGPLFPASDKSTHLDAELRDRMASSPVLDWDKVLEEPAVTYIALRATASSEDVELMGRIIAQDLKQVCSRRTQAIAHGMDCVPVLMVIDEFAALREAEQFVDLLLQARQALMPVVLSTQYLPEELRIRKAALEAGLIIAHRLETEDAQIVGAQFGTRKVWDDTVQMSPEGASGWGSARQVDVYHVHPNELRDMRRGYAAIRSVPGDRRAIVQIYRANEGVLTDGHITTKL